MFRKQPFSHVTQKRLQGLHNLKLLTQLLCTRQIDLIELMSHRLSFFYLDGLSCVTLSVSQMPTQLWWSIIIPVKWKRALTGASMPGSACRIKVAGFWVSRWVWKMILFLKKQIAFAIMWLKKKIVGGGGGGERGGTKWLGNLTPIYSLNEVNKFPLQ